MASKADYLGGNARDAVRLVPDLEVRVDAALRNR